jgi:hypothetical protein
VLHLIAHMLSAPRHGASIAGHLTRSVNPGLIETMFGQHPSEPLQDQEAGAFAHLALERARPPGDGRLAVMRCWRQLRPLHITMLGRQQMERPGAPGCARFRLHRQVVAIRDAELALKPYRAADTAAAAEQAAARAGLTGDERRRGGGRGSRCRNSRQERWPPSPLATVPETSPAFMAGC